MVKERAVPIKEQSPEERIENFDEVPLGYSPEEAVKEAQRCLNCKNAPCIEGCPVRIEIPQFINHIANRRFDQAIETIKEGNNLPGVCGRVCPQENQCQEVCTLGKKYEPVNIGRLERFAADWELEHGGSINQVSSSRDSKVAVVGSGPSGLTAAADLRKMGYGVTVFEQFHQPGGVMVYGIPEFRLPNYIVENEVQNLEKMGVRLRTNCVVGRLFTVDDLLTGKHEREYDAVFIGTGAGLPHFLNLPGENLNGIYSANEFLTRVNLMKAYKFPEYDTPIQVGERVAVIGGGNVAVDSARTALRLGAEESIIIYRRSESELPARREEVEHAKEEGVQFKLLSNPVEFQGSDSWVNGVRCRRMELGQPDESGRPRPVPIEGSEFTVPVDTVIIAVGTSPHPLVTRTTPGLETSDYGTILTAEEGRTTKEGVWAGGDIVTGAATVIEAMGAGKSAAKDIHRYLQHLTTWNGP